MTSCLNIVYIFISCRHLIYKELYKISIDGAIQNVHNKGIAISYIVYVKIVTCTLSPNHICTNLTTTNRIVVLIMYNYFHETYGMT